MNKISNWNPVIVVITCPAAGSWFTHLIVRRHIEGHHSVQESLRGLVIGEQGVPIDVVQVTWLWEGAAWGNSGDVGSIQTEQVIQPALHWVAIGVSYRFIEDHFVQDTTWVESYELEYKTIVQMYNRNS